MFRILSIDGGGIKGILPASFLKTIEDTAGKPVREHFDLITGTSTGGIIALGLGLGFSAEEILVFYKTYGPSIFPTKKRLQRTRLWLKHWTFVKYKSEPLKIALEETFGDRKLGESTTRLVIPSISATTGGVYIYKTRHHERFRVDHHERVVDVALGTSSAPTYFPVHKTPGGVRLLDGGMWANNPLMVGIIEAMTILKIPREEIVALSLGTTAAPQSVGELVATKGGKLAWASAATEFFMHGQSASAENQAGLLLGKDRLIRVQREVAPGHYSMDGWKMAENLEGMGKELAREYSPQVLDTFFQTPVKPFVPIP